MAFEDKLIDHEAVSVITRLKQKGFTAYLVGGSVRDLLCQRVPKDFDISTNARPEEIKKIFGKQCLLIGRRFRLAHIRFGKKILEVSTFRASDSQQGSLVVEDNLWGTEEEDAMRRDFTINGLFYAYHEDEIIDYVGGLEDIQKQLIRSIGNPFDRFREDPVRMLRLLKFRARFNWNIAKNDEQALHVLKEEILKCSSARVLEELLKMLESGYALPFLNELEKYGILPMLLPYATSFKKEKERNLFHKSINVIDEIQTTFGKESLTRPLILSSILVSGFLKEINFSSSLHLGDITLLSQKTVHRFMEGSFLRLTKKLVLDTSNLIARTYFLMKMKKNPASIERQLRMRDFSFSLKMLRVLSLIDPIYLEHYNFWKEEVKKSSHRHEKEIHPKVFSKHPIHH